MRRLLRTIGTATIALWTVAAHTVAAHAGEGSPPAPADAQAQPPAPSSAPPPASSAPAAPAAQTPPPAAQNQGTPATVLDTQDYESLLGKSVRAANGDDLGRIIDIIIDRDGRPRAAIIDFGGFLGVGSRKIAVEWRALRFATEGKVGRLTLQLNRNQVRVSPEYKPGEPIVVLGPSSPSAPAEGEQAAAPAVQPAAAPPAPAPDKAAQEKPAEKPADKPETKPEK